MQIMNSLFASILFLLTLGINFGVVDAFEISLHTESNFQGDSEPFDIKGCLPSLPDIFNYKVGSLKTNGECVVFYREVNCTGPKLVLGSGSSDSGYNLRKYNMVHSLKSISDCGECGADLRSNSEEEVYNVRFGIGEDREVPFGCIPTNVTSLKPHRAGLVHVQHGCVQVYVGNDCDPDSSFTKITNHPSHVERFAHWSLHNTIGSISHCDYRCYIPHPRRHLRGMNNPIVVLYPEPNFEGKPNLVKIGNTCHTLDVGMIKSVETYGNCIDVFTNNDCDPNYGIQRLDENIRAIHRNLMLMGLNLATTAKSIRLCNVSTNENLAVVVKTSFQNVTVIEKFIQVQGGFGYKSKEVTIEQTGCNPNTNVQLTKLTESHFTVFCSVFFEEGLCTLKKIGMLKYEKDDNLVGGKPLDICSDCLTKHWTINESVIVEVVFNNNEENTVVPFGCSEPKFDKDPQFVKELNGCVQLYASNDCNPHASSVKLLPNVKSIDYGYLNFPNQIGSLSHCDYRCQIPYSISDLASLEHSNTTIALYPQISFFGKPHLMDLGGRNCVKFDVNTKSINTYGNCIFFYDSNNCTASEKNLLVLNSGNEVLHKDLNRMLSQSGTVMGSISLCNEEQWKIHIALRNSSVNFNNSNSYANGTNGQVDPTEPLKRNAMNYIAIGLSVVSAMAIVLVIVIVGIKHKRRTTVSEINLQRLRNGENSRD